MGPPRSYAKGVLVNALSPHPYLFWLLVGAPLMLKAAQQSLGLPILFLISFYVCLIGAKAVLALLVGHSREYISGAVYLWIMRALGLCLIAVSILLLKDGLALTGRP